MHLYVTKEIRQWHSEIAQSKDLMLNYINLLLINFLCWTHACYVRFYKCIAADSLQKVSNNGPTNHGDHQIISVWKEDQIVASFYLLDLHLFRY